jgi:endonuclease YncB( thermonuclease family)
MQAEPDTVPTTTVVANIHTTEAKPKPITYRCPDDTINCSYETAKPFVPPVVSGFVIKVYDGDTITIAATSGDGINRRFSVRLAGIDTAEITSKDPNLKLMATKAKEHLIRLCFNKVVLLSDVSCEKYGRLLATVHLTDQDGGTCLNKDMVLQQLAVPYTGGTKEPELLRLLTRNESFNTNANQTNS